MRTAIWLMAGVSMLVATTATATSERTVKELHKGTDHRDLYAMAVSTEDSNAITAVGAFGTLLVSKDGGETWENNNIKTDQALFDIAIAGEHQVIVGQTGLVMVRDGDGPWKEVEVDTDARLLSVDTNRAGLTYAVGQFGVVLRSLDGGDTWQKLDLKLAEKIEGGYDPHLYDVHVGEDGIATVVGEFGLIMRSKDQGKNWVIVNTSDESLFALQIRDDGVGFAAGQSGAIFRTENGGENWARLDNKLDANLLGIWSSPDGTVTAPGFRHMLVSDDNGESWRQVENQDVNRGWYIDARTISGKPGVIAVGYSGKVIRIIKTKN